MSWMYTVFFFLIVKCVLLFKRHPKSNDINRPLFKGFLFFFSSSSALVSIRCCLSCLLMDTAAHWVYEDPEIKALQEWRLFSPPLETMEHVSVQFMSDRLYKLGTERQQYGHYCTNGHLCELVRHCELNLSELITADMVAHLAGEQTGPHQICGIIHVYLATAVCFDWGAHWGAQKHTVRSRENMTKVDNLWFHFILDFVYLFFYWFSVSSVLISEQCGCISHRSVLGSVIQPSLFHRETTHTHTHTHTHLLSSNEVRGLSVCFVS